MVVAPLNAAGEAPAATEAPSPSTTAGTTVAHHTERAGRAVGIAGLGAYLPEGVVTNRDLERTLDTSDEWIRGRTGIVQRHVAADSEATSDLAVRAAEAALDDAGIAADDLGAVLVATTTPDHPMPGTAPIVAHRLGIQVAAFDLNAACSGFIYGLYVGDALAASGTEPVLLVGADALTRIVDATDRSTAVLFGDGAGAAVLAPQDGAAIGPFDLGCDGSLADILCVPAGGARHPADAGTVARRDHFMKMQGREVYRHAVTRMAASSAAVLEAAHLKPDEVDLFVGHQANIRILDAVARRVGIAADRCHITVDQHGNTSAASVPLALEDARRSGRLHAGTRVLLTAFGAGLTWGSCLVRIGDRVAPDSGRDADE